MGGWGSRKGSAVHPVAARHYVVVQRASGGDRLAGGDPFDDGAMLAHGDGQDAALGERRVAEEM
jgi:hypothetical protein